MEVLWRHSGRGVTSSGVEHVARFRRHAPLLVVKPTPISAAQRHVRAHTSHIHIPTAHVPRRWTNYYRAIQPYLVLEATRDHSSLPRIYPSHAKGGKLGLEQCTKSSIQPKRVLRSASRVTTTVGSGLFPQQVEEEFSRQVLSSTVRGVWEAQIHGQPVTQASQAL